MVKISVIIPVYNVEKYIEQCIDSVLSQSFSDFEIIAVDDGSTDNSLNILKGYDDRRVKVFHQENSGAGCARNKGLGESSGEYIFFLDGDDWIESTAFEELCNKACENDCDMILFNSRAYDSDKTHDRIYLHDGNFENCVFNYKDVKDLVMNSIFVVWSKFYKKSFLDKNNIRFSNFSMFNDVTFHVKTMILADKISYLNKILYNYNRVNETSVQSSNSTNGNSVLIFDVFESVYDFLKKNNYLKEFEKNFILSVIKQAKVYFDKVEDEFKDEFYLKMREEFLKIKSHPKLISKIPFEYYTFYINVVSFKTYSEFKVVNHYKNNVDELYFGFINKKEMDKKIDELSESGINKTHRDKKIIVSLTSFNQRISEVHYCIYSLLKQTLKPDRIILWLSDDEFPKREDDLTGELINLKKYGLEIGWCDNLMSFKKLLPSLEAYPEDIIITCDDDVVYPATWLESLYNEHLKNPDCLICTRARNVRIAEKYTRWELCKNYKKASYKTLMTGIGGVLYPPDCLKKDVSDYKLAEKLCPTADDLWFWAMAVLCRTKIIKIDSEIPTSINILRDLKLTDKKRLFDSNINKNDLQVENILNEYPEIAEIIGSEND